MNKQETLEAMKDSLEKNAPYEYIWGSVKFDLMDPLDRLTLIDFSEKDFPSISQEMDFLDVFSFLNLIKTVLIFEDWLENW